jgi:tRNA-dihydrouridine synthase B
MSFWDNLTKPIIGLSPMDGVTDAAYRHLQAVYGKPDVIYTEFIPVEGIVRLSERLLQDFWYADVERPVIAQVYGNDPVLFYACAQLVCEMGFDGVDINMGCPAKSVVHRGCGAALIKTPDLAKQIIRAVQQGVADWEESGVNWAKWPVISGRTAKSRFKKFVSMSQQKGIYQGLELNKKTDRKAIPVTVKTRIGFSTPIVEEWIPHLLETGVEVITVHGRTLRQLYTGAADWNELGKLAGIRDKYTNKSAKPYLLGNGDIKSVADFDEKFLNSGLDGILIGRGTYGNPRIFEQIRAHLRGEELNDPRQDTEKQFEIMLEHAKLHEKYKSGPEFAQMRKNLAWYVSGIPRAAELRSKLVRTNSSTEVQQIITDYCDTI